MKHGITGTGRYVAPAQTITRKARGLLRPMTDRDLYAAADLHHPFIAYSMSYR